MNDSPALALGLVTPVLTLLPRAHARWEESAGIEAVREIAVAADRSGYDHITCSEHVGIPTAVAEVRGGRYWDPLATFGFLAAHTERVRFATHVLVLGYHHPLEIAKRYGTLDQVCGGRVVLGVGVGSLQEEFELLDAPFDGRGDRADDALRALRAAFGVARPEYAGTHYAFDDFVIDPHGTQRAVPIWIGGRSARSLRRSVELADGWAPFGLTLDEIATMLERAASTTAWNERDTPIEVWLQPERPLDPLGDPTGTGAHLDALRAAGATGVNARLVHHSLTHCTEQVEALAELTHTG